MLFNTKLGREGCHSITFRLCFQLSQNFLYKMSRNVFDDSVPLPGPVLPGEELLAEFWRGPSQGWLHPW